MECKQLSVATIVGTRPELIKLSRVLAALDKRTDHTLIHTGQNHDFELNGIFFRDLVLREPDHFLDAAGATVGETIGNVIARSYGLLAELRPDALLLLGDTNSCLAVIAAKRLKIPVFHMEAGNRCFDDRVPEEINRRLVDHLSDINLPYTEHARRYLLREGLSPETVIKTGSPMREVLEHYGPGIEASTVLADLGLEAQSYFVASAHREENVDDERHLRSLLDSLTAVVERFDRDIIFSTHPRTRQRIKSLTEGVELSSRIRLLEPLGLLDYIQLQKQAFCVLSDSGTVTEEAALLGFPAVTVRQAHERPEGMDEATLVMSGLDPVSVVRAVGLVTADQSVPLELPEDYRARNVSAKVVRLITSYVNYVNRTVWRRDEL